MLENDCVTTRGDSTIAFDGSYQLLVDVTVIQTVTVCVKCTVSDSADVPTTHTYTVSDITYSVVLPCAIIPPSKILDGSADLNYDIWLVDGTASFTARFSFGGEFTTNDPINCPIDQVFTATVSNSAYTTPTTLPTYVTYDSLTQEYTLDYTPGGTGSFMFYLAAEYSPKSGNFQYFTSLLSINTYCDPSVITTPSLNTP